MKLFYPIYTVLVITCALAVPWNAYAKEKINSVNIRIEAEDFDDRGRPQLTASSNSRHYSVENIENAYDYYGAGDPGDSGTTYKEDTDVYVIELYAEDGYYFNITKSDKIHINGLGADFIKATRKNNGSDLIITVRLKNLEQFVGEIEDAKWDRDGFASWTEARGAQSYILIFSDEKGRNKRVETCGTTYDFRPFMQKSGSYSYRVRPLSATRKTGEWVTGGIITINDVSAENNRQMFQVEKEVSYKDGIKTPENQIVVYKNVGWQENDEGRRWYRNQDASYLQNVWMQEGDAWYYFGGDGYCIMDDYLTYGGDDYYFSPDGTLVTNANVPDGRTADESGALSAKNQ